MTSLATLRLDGDRIAIRAPGAQLDTWRPLAEGAAQLFARWSDDYRRALRASEPAAALLALGQELYRWVDGDEGWLARVRKDAVPPLLLEIAVPFTLEGLDLAFVEAPWELLADARGHLAADENLVFGPVRRLGTRVAPPPPSEHRLSLVFMAAAPDGASSLSYEHEETAILEATERSGVDLTVEESGTLEGLAALLAQEKPVDVLHLSCHGTTSPEPQLLLEDDVGLRAPASAADLAGEIGGNLPARLLHLSACLTADPFALLGSLSAAMIRRGCPAALGWGGSVGDIEATRFTALLYQHLARREGLEEAVARARHALLAPGRDVPAKPARDWHLARLYLGPEGGGPFTRGSKARRRTGKDHGHRAFLDVRRQAIPVASAREFVGRRRQLQAILREMRAPEHAGVVLHGFGHHGKSSLAARVANRMADHEIAVLHEHHGALDVLDAIRSAATRAEVDAIVARDRDAVRDDPARLAAALREILEGPCREVERNERGDVVRRPLLLIVDDFERALDPPQGGLHRIKPSLSAGVRALVEVFGRARTDSRLLFTSRYAFTLPAEGRELGDRLLHVHLGPMSETEGEKQATAKLRARAGAGNDVDPARVRRCVRVARGNPGLQDLLFASALDAPAACDTALEAMERYLAGGEEPDEQTLRGWLEELAVGKLVGWLTGGEQALLRASALFSIPAPLGVLEVLAEALGLPAREQHGERLFALGVWDVHVDPGAAGGKAALPNPLVRPRLTPLSAEEEASMAAAVVEPLLARWRETGRRPLATSFELARLGVLAGHAGAVACAGQGGVRWLAGMEQQVRAAELGRACVRVLDERGEAAPIGLLRTAGEACHAVSDVVTARGFYGRAVEAMKGAGDTLDAEDRAALLLSHGRLLVQDGLLDGALAAFEEARALLAGDAFVRERAVTLGEIARIRVSKGEVDAALALHQEELQVYEELGDRRSRAVTLGDIARIRVSKGEVDAALALHQERLKVFEELGDRRERAVTLGDIARIRVSKGEVDAALALHQERLKVFEELGDRRERAVTLGDIARIRVSKGEVDAALALHQEMLKVFEELGDRRSRAVTLGDIARIRVSKGEVDAALALHQERLKVFEELGDRRSRAVTLGDIARIRVSKGEVDAALALHQERLKVFEELGDRRERAVTLGDIARIRVSKGEVDAALALHQERLKVFEELGDRRSRAVTLGDIARIRVSKGEVDAALALHQERLKVFEELGDRRSRAVTLGDIARIRVDKGEVDAALALHQEALQVFEELGDRRSRAVTLGDIARIRVDKGEVDAALALHQERLKVNEELGNPDGIANALWSIGSIALEKGDVQKAYDHFARSYGLLRVLGRLDGICFVGLDLGRLLLAAGHATEAAEILTRSRDGFRRLGQHPLAQQVQELLD